MEWIKCSERLPEGFKDVLISFNDGFGGVCVGYLYNGIWRMFDVEGMSELDYVTHWMPLPKPPEGD